MQYYPIVFNCLALTTNTFYVVLPVKARILGALWVANGDPGVNNTVEILPDGGSDIITGIISATPGAVVKGTVTATLANAIQVIDPATTALKIVLDTTAACVVSMNLNLDVFAKKTAT